MKKNIKVSLFYNVFIVIFVFALEINADDTTGMGLLWILILLIPITVLHAARILYVFFKKHDKSFNKALLNVLGVVGINICAFFMDILLVVVTLNLLDRVNIIHTELIGS
ncbi:MAG: hypothetical protein PHQ96_00575 [Candidatus Omnitrophica bacterium]|nr:hypothetical protein [Candidatus Omnitrophota bacterium]